MPDSVREPSKGSGPSIRTGGLRRRPTPVPPPIRFEQILLEEGAITPEQLRDLILRQQTVPKDKRLPLGLMALEAGLIDEPRLLALLDIHGRRLYLGELLVLRRLLRPEGLAAALRQQREDEFLGETLLRLSLIEPTALAEGMAEQCGVASVPIFRIPPDPRLARYINGPYAVRHGIVPVALRGQCLVVAFWSPQSLELVGDVERAGGIEIIPVLTTREEIENRIRAIYLGLPAAEPEARAA